MFRSIDRSPRRRNRAVTLIEAVLYISIALALIVGGLVFFQQASTAAKTSTMVRQLSATLAEGRVVMKGMPLTSTDVDLTKLFIAAGAMPSDMVPVLPSWTSDDIGAVSNPFGGTTSFFGNSSLFGRQITIILTNVPQKVCARLLTATSGGNSTFGPGMTGATTLVSSGFVSSGVGIDFYATTPRNHLMNPTQAGWMCKYGSNAYITKTSEPSSATPLSGNVILQMAFLVER
jgi:hypothetical protein